MNTPCRLHLLVLWFSIGLIRLSAAEPLPLLNLQSGISMALSGTNGVDWAVSHHFHDPEIADQVVYVKDSARFSFAHNERNSLMNRTVPVPPVPGILGADGIPRSGDEGEIRVKINRDLQSHPYSGASEGLPAWAPAFPEPFRFADLSYDDGVPVLGRIGDNGGAWGSSPRSNPARIAYAQRDAFGNEWHTVTYWDNDAPLYAKAGVNPHRQAASDGHWVSVCVNPLTPVLQLTAPAGEQFYTTPNKTYFVPKIWAQQTYATDGVRVHFVNLTDDQPVQFRIGDGAWRTYEGQPLRLGDLIADAKQPVLLSFRNGAEGAVETRPFLLNPTHPGAEETPGRLLWPDEAARAYHLRKLKEIQPFAAAYTEFARGVTGANKTTDLIRGGWRSGAGAASRSLDFAFVAAVEGLETRADEAAFAKTLLLRLGRLEAVGGEADVNHATPAKDYLNELSQTLQLYADAGIAYDLLAGFFRSDRHPAGMTPIEELRIRDGLAEVAKTVLQFRSNWSFQQGGGDTHWAHGFEVMIGFLAAAMPTYASPYFGAAGLDPDAPPMAPSADGTFWNPFPDQGVSWWAAVTDPDIATPGFPNVKAPFRAEMLYTDDGWWVGPNDFIGDGDRYHQGVLRNQLVDLNHGGLSNAECRVELLEMGGYEAPFVERLYVFAHLRRRNGDTHFPPGADTYLRRRLIAGYTPLRWDAKEKIHTAEAPRFDTNFPGVTLDAPGARLPGARAQMNAVLLYISKSYGLTPGEPSPQARDARRSLAGAYALALCVHPDDLPAPEPEPNFAPILKPLMKQVVRTGERVHKTILAMDLNEDPLEIRLAGLPAGASYDSDTRTLDWRPGEADTGVHLITVTVSDGKTETEAPFLVMVKAAGAESRIPESPKNLRVSRVGSRAILSWEPSPAPDALYTLVYRDGVPRAVLPAAETRFRDPGLLPGTHTRFALSTISASGSESFASFADPAVLHRPLD